MDIKEVEKIMSENAELKKLLETQKPQKDPKEDFEKMMLGVALNEKISFDIIIDERNFFQRLTGKKNEVFYVREYLNLDKTIRISKKLLEIPEFVIEDKSDSELLYQNIETIAIHTDKIVEIICILFNTKKHKFIKDNLKNEDMFKIVTAMFKMTGHLAFMNTIASLRSKASLKSE